MSIHPPPTFSDCIRRIHGPSLIVNLGRRSIVEGLMEPLMVVKLEIAGQPYPRLAGRRIILQIHLLPLDGAPQPLREYVVQRATASIHTNLDSRSQQHTGVLRRGEMATLVAIPDQ